MKKLLVVLVVMAVAMLSACTPETETAAVEFKTYTMEQFMKIVGVGGGSFNDAETKLLIHSNETGVYNAYSIDMATGEQTQLTNSEDTTYVITYMPGSEAFMYMRDFGGNELYKLYLQDEEGNITQLTQGENTRELFAGFSHDRKSFYTSNNSRDPKFMDLYKWDLETMQPVLVYKNETGMNVSDVSRDGRWLALGQTHSDFDSDMYIIDLEGDGQPVYISEHEGEINHSPAAFTPDNKKLLYTTDKDSDFMYLMSYDLETGEREEVFRGDMDIVGAGYSHSGKYRVIYENAVDVVKLHMTDLETGQPYELKNLPAGDISGFSISLSEKYARFYNVADDMPSNLFIYDFATEQAKQLSDNLNKEIDPRNLVKSELINLTARDGLKFNGFLYKPILASSENKVPALLYIHGGPGGQSRPTYSYSKQYFVNQGYAIFDLNYRGSGGYGRAFSMADDRKHGKEPLWDCVDAKNWLVENVDWIDADKIGIMGGSYGGYMTMAALAYEPEEFKVGVNLFGVTNWVRTLKSIPPYWESFRLALYRELGNPETDEAMLYEISPLFHADKITKPVIVLQGANDPRVIQPESDEMVENIRKAGGVAEYVLFPDEGHGFAKTKNKIEGYTAVLKFLDKYLKGIPEEPAEEPAKEAPEGE